MKGPKSLAQYFGNRWATNTKRLRVPSNRRFFTEEFGEAIITGEGVWATVYLGKVKVLKKPEKHRARDLMQKGYDSLFYDGCYIILSMEQVYLEEEAVCSESKETDKCVACRESSQEVASVSCAESEECVVCLEGPQEVAFIPCGHKVLCTTCAETTFPTCLICRRKVEGTLRVF
jgi:hypothetical protein